MILPSTIANHANQIVTTASRSYDHWHTLDECLKTFSIVSKTAKTNLSNYCLLYWEPSYLLEILEGDDKSYITRAGIRYYVIYMEMLSPEYLKEYKRIRVSFRKPEFLSFGFVLIRSFREKE